MEQLPSRKQRSGSGNRGHCENFKKLTKIKESGLKIERKNSTNITRQNQREGGEDGGDYLSVLYRLLIIIIWL